ncbi:hypothetical protein [Alteromonas gilva]|uniref:Uncharacterized protein n=1 Tax=Alteromonas gilva TaxID=2987522 RepID=A0ABT5L042_9ALTE|nr:hypothetical protein [Alteromonas gilva]MDC8829252.1 hypothetical protein [Alteromonas gilva]
MLLIIVTATLCCIPLCLLARVNQKERYRLYYGAARRGDLAMLRYFNYTGYAKHFNHHQHQSVISVARQCQQHDVVEYLTRQ